MSSISNQSASSVVSDPIYLEKLKKGLSSAEVLTLQQSVGLNKLPEKKPRTKSSIIAEQFKSPLIYIITVAALISIILTEYNDAVIIAVVIAVDVVVGFYQEYSAEQTMSALKNLIKPITRVIREGNVMEVEVSLLVPGDNLHNISVDIMKDKTLLQFHFDIQPETSLEVAHQVASEVEHKIEEELPLSMRHNLEIISHIEPARLPPAKIHHHVSRPISQEIHEKIASALNNMTLIKKWSHLNVLEEDKDVSVTLTAYFDPEMKIADVHHATEETEVELRKFVPNMKRCIIHTEPFKDLK